MDITKLWNNSPLTSTTFSELSSNGFKHGSHLIGKEKEFVQVGFRKKRCGSSMLLIRNRGLRSGVINLMKNLNTMNFLSRSIV